MTILDWVSEYKEHIINKKMAIVLGTLFLIYTVGISSVIRANYSYIDDLGRIYKGYKGWDDFGRYLSNLLSVFIHADRYLMDVSPLPQIIAAFVMSCASVALICSFIEWDTVKTINILAVVPLAMSPYFLECFLYKYDAPYMALSVLVSVLPVLFRDSRKGVCYFVAFFGALFMMMTYQGASGVFPMLVIAVSYVDWNRGKNLKSITLYIIISALGYLCGIMFFLKIVLKPINSYISPGVANYKIWIPQLLKHYSTVIDDFKVIWIYMILILIAFFAIVSVAQSSRNKAISLGMCLLTLSLMLGCCFGIYPFITTPTYTPRTMYGLGCFIAILAVVISQCECRVSYVGKITYIALAWCFVVFAFSVGNALAEQQRYTDFRIEEVIDDLAKIEYLNNEKEVIVQLEGVMEYSPVLRNFPNSSTMLYRLIPSTFGEGWTWRNYYFFHYFDMKNIKEDSSVNLLEFDLPIISETMYHTIKGNEQYILIEIK